MIITLLYASLAALFLIFLSVTVIKNRVKIGAAVGDKNDISLQLAIRAHSNFIEYTGLFLIMLGLLETVQTSIYLLHALGIIFFLGRIAHAYSLLKVETYDNGKITSSIKHRQGGMMFTFLALGASALIGLYSVISYYLG